MYVGEFMHGVEIKLKLLNKEWNESGKSQREEENDLQALRAILLHHENALK